MMAQRIGQRIQAHPFARVARDLDDLESQAFAGLQPRIEGGRLDGDQVAGSGQGLQAEVEPSIAPDVTTISCGETEAPWAR